MLTEVLDFLVNILRCLLFNLPNIINVSKQFIEGVTMLFQCAIVLDCLLKLTIKHLQVILSHHFRHAFFVLVLVGLTTE